MSVRFAKCLIALALAGLLAACATEPPELVLSTKSAVELRAMQSRAFETENAKKVYRAVISTFQDLGYTISKVEPAAGTVTADKLSLLKMTASVYPRGEGRTIVRANAIVKLNLQIKTGHQVDAPEFYQQRFFEPLAKALFLTALQVEDSDIPSDPADKKPALPAGQPETKAEAPGEIPSKTDAATTGGADTNTAKAEKAAN